MASSVASSSAAGAAAAAATSSTDAAFTDHNAILSAITRMTIPPIKAALKEISTSIPELGTQSMYGKKADLTQRLQNVFNNLMQAKLHDKYRTARSILERIYGSAITTYRPPNNPPYRYMPAQNAYQMYPPSMSYGSFPGAYAPYVQHPRPAVASAQHPSRRHMGTFKASPFYTFKNWVSEAIHCPALQSQKATPARMHFELSPEQVAQLRDSKSNLQLRLFCTTEMANRASMSGAHPAPIEFPLHCDIRVNHTTLSVTIRGKKSPAKILPPNLNKDGKLNLTSPSNRMNTVELLYVNTSSGYMMAAGLCEMHPVDSLVKDVKENKVKSKEQVLREMKKAANDEDIEVGQTTINLKCPLSYMRLSAPCRSAVCSHIQCFDASSFFSINEQTPSWQCPICSKTVDPATLFLDGYVLDILQRVPEEEELIEIDAEGRWNTPNKKFRSDEIADAAATKLEGPLASGVGTSGDAGLHDTIANGMNSGNVKNERESMGAIGETSTPGTPVDATPIETNGRGGKKIEVLELDDSPSPPPKRVVIATNDGIMTSSSSTPTLATATSSSVIYPPPVLSRSTSLHTGGSMTFNGMSGTLLNATRPQAASGGDVIDLTFSDSDDDDDVPLSNRSTSIAPGPPMPSAINRAMSTSSNDQSSTTSTPQMMHAAPRPMLPRPPARTLPSPIDRFFQRTNSNSGSSAGGGGAGSGGGSHSAAAGSSTSMSAPSPKAPSTFAPPEKDHEGQQGHATVMPIPLPPPQRTEHDEAAQQPTDKSQPQQVSAVNGQRQISRSHSSTFSSASPGSSHANGRISDKRLVTAPTDVRNGERRKRSDDDGDYEDEDDRILAPSKRPRSSQNRPTANQTRHPVIEDDEEFDDDFPDDFELDEFDVDPNAGL